MADGEGERKEPSENEKALQIFTKKDYELRLLDPDFTSQTQEEQAAELGVSRMTLHNWRKDIDWNEIKDKRRALYASQTVKVDDAVMRKAQAGDIRAAEVYYQRFDGWEPAQKINLESKTDAELKERAEKLAASLVELKAKENDGKPTQGGTPENNAGDGAAVKP